MHRPTVNAYILDACQEFCPAITFFKDRVKFTWFRIGTDESDPILQLIYSYRLGIFETCEGFGPESSLPIAREQASQVREAVYSIINGVTL